MAEAIRILTPCEDGTGRGTGRGTKVTMGGLDVPKVVSVQLSEISCDTLLTATITVLVCECDIYAHPMLSLESLTEAAAAHGLTLLNRDGQALLPPSQEPVARLSDGHLRHPIEPRD